tara:strand:+ start:1877 stop:2074 length:198 start_codon:yes stop_codon:yes gene_type:complete
MAKKEHMKGKKYKATSTFDVNAFNNFEGLGNENHAKLTRGEIVTMEDVPKNLIKNKMIEEVGGKK